MTISSVPTQLQPTYALTTVKMAKPAALERTSRGMTLSSPLLPLSTNERNILAAFLHSCGSVTGETKWAKECGVNPPGRLRGS